MYAAASPTRGLMDASQGALISFEPIELPFLADLSSKGLDT